LQGRNGVLLFLAAVAGLACGGPGVIDPGPTQSVAYYFAGTDDTGALHVHVHWVQSKHNLTLLSPCDPRDHCDIYAYNATGITELGLTQPPLVVNLASGSGTFADPGISFTITTVNGKTFTFNGTVATSGSNVQMVGTLTGTNGNHPSSRLVLDRQP
jgi:hypothetical protein